MKYLKTTFFKTAIILTVLWLGGCVYTNTYQPELNAKQQTILDSINSKYGFENVSLLGKKTSGSGGDHTTLTIRFTNGKNIPTDTAQMKAAARQLAIQVKGALKNPKEFESYTVLFNTSVTNGAVTTNNYVGYDFKDAELK